MGETRKLNIVTKQRAETLVIYPQRIRTDCQYVNRLHIDYTKHTQFLHKNVSLSLCLVSAQVTMNLRRYCCYRMYRKDLMGSLRALLRRRALDTTPLKRM